MSECPHPYGTCACVDRKKSPFGDFEPVVPYALSEHAQLDAKAKEKGEPCVYAWDACEDSSLFSGPFATVADALAEFLDEHDVEDDHHVEVTLAKAAGFPEAACVSERLSEHAYEDFGEHASEALDNACGDGKALDAAVNAAVRAWLEANGGNPLAGYWTPYGRWISTTAKEAREWLVALEAAEEALEAAEEAETERVARAAW